MEYFYSHGSSQSLVTEVILFFLQGPRSTKLQSKRSLSPDFLAINKALTPSGNCVTGYFIPSGHGTFEGRPEDKV